MVVTVSNPVNSVLFLILSFCMAASISILFGVEFLGLLFIIIYVGALAVLFLFVVMMLNVKTYSSRITLITPLVLLIILLIGSQLLVYSSILLNNSPVAEAIASVDALGNLVVFSQVLYNFYLGCFLIAGMILLLAMVGAIILTLSFKSQRQAELSFRQLSRSNRFITFFK
jgi:NADH-quinone oxidoreductase subunit J